MKYIIETSKLSYNFGNFSVLNNISLQVKENAIYGFLGPNGAGKSTTIKTILGLYKNITPSVTFHFSNNYLISHISAKRYMDYNGKLTLTDWEVVITDYKLFGDKLLPEKCEIYWKSNNFNFCWFKFKVTDIKYNF